MKQTREDRLEIINQLILFISERGRRFFYSKGTIKNDNEDSVAYMKIVRGRIYFVDNYTKRSVLIKHGSHEWKGFSHGGTLRALILDFTDFIRTGHDTDGKNGYGGLHCPHWGHGDEIQREIINYARKIGYLK